MANEVFFLEPNEKIYHQCKSHRLIVDLVVDEIMNASRNRIPDVRFMASPSHRDRLRRPWMRTFGRR